MDDESIPTLTEQSFAYALALLPVGAVLYGLLVLSRTIAVRKKLHLSAVITGSLDVAAACLGGRPEALLDRPSALPLALLYVAGVLRLLADSCVGSLARRADSPGIALL